jgi:hypothetical protein
MAARTSRRPEAERSRLAVNFANFANEGPGIRIPLPPALSPERTAGPVGHRTGRDGFWLARWLEARGVEAHVIHPSSVAVSREHRRAKTDRLDTELLKRVSYRLDRGKLRQARSREGRYLLRTNLVEEDPAKLWSHYLLLAAVEEAFKNLKGDLAIRPVFHQLEARVEAHVFIAFLAY